MVERVYFYVRTVLRSARCARCQLTYTPTRIATLFLSLFEVNKTLFIHELNNFQKIHHLWIYIKETEHKVCILTHDA